MQQQYDVCAAPSPVVINNNPKLKSLLEPFVIPTYGQLKQPNANSAFHSSVISATGGNSGSSLLSLSNVMSSSSGTNGASNVGSGSQPVNGLQSANQQQSTQQNLLAGFTSSNLAASAFSSAVLVTENVSNFGNKNKALLFLAIFSSFRNPDIF